MSSADKYNLLDLLLIEDKSFHINNIIGTTYSLEMDVLFSLIVNISCETEIEDENNGSHIRAIDIKSINSLKDCVLIYCDPANIKCPDKNNQIYHLLDNIIFPVRLNATGKNNYPSFHPKMWLVEYYNSETEEYRYRIISSSKNITSSNFLEYCIYFDAKKNADDGIDGNTSELIKFISFMADNTGTLNKVAPILDRLKNYTFDSEELSNRHHLLDFCFFYPGHHKDQEKIFGVNNAEQRSVVSPFLDDETIQKIIEVSKSNKMILYTSENELYKIQNCRNKYKKLAVKILGDLVDEDGKKCSGLHAKIYYCMDNTSMHNLYIGSCNATNTAFNRNVEMLLGVKFDSKFGDSNYFVGSILGDAVIKNMYEVSNDAVFNNTEDEEDNYLFKKAVHSKYTGLIERQDDGTYNVIVTVDEKNTLTYEYLSLYPFGLDNKVIKGNEEQLIFRNIDITDLSEFFVLKYQDEDTEQSSIIKIPLEGFDENLIEARNNGIFKKCLDHKPNQIINIIAYILSGVTPSSIKEDIIEGDGGFESSREFAKITRDLFEKMMKAKANPDERYRLDEVFKTIKTFDFCDDEIVRKLFAFLELFKDER